MSERRSIYAICALEDIPNRRARGFMLARAGEGGRPQGWSILILRWGRHVRAYENRCPHQGTNLDWEAGEFLDADGTRIQCGKHGALFDLGTGACVDGPCVGAHLTAIETVIDDGDICLVGVDLFEDDEEDSGAGVE